MPLTFSLSMQIHSFQNGFESRVLPNGVRSWPCLDRGQIRVPDLYGVFQLAEGPFSLAEFQVNRRCQGRRRRFKLICGSQCVFDTSQAGHPNTRFRSDIPTLCVYGRHDEMLKLDDADQEEAYRRAFEERFSNIDFDTFASDHFMTGIKEDVARSIHQFLHDLSEIPLPTGF